jgi:hypothetical protein
MYNCNSNWSLSQSKSQIMVETEAKAKVVLPPFDPMAMEHCPDFDERMTLLDGKTVGIPYPAEHFNCNADWALAQKKVKTETPDPNGFAGLEHCPDFDERFTLANGTTKAIPYPQS